MTQKTEPLCVLGLSPLLGSGGAEKSLLRLVNNVDRNKVRPSVAVVRAGGAYENNLAGDVPLHVLCRGPVWSSAGRLLRALPAIRRLVQHQRPDIIFSVMDRTNVALMLALWGLRERPAVVLSVQNNPRAKYESQRGQFVDRAVFFLMKRLYPQADRIVTISRGVDEELTAMIPEVQDRTDVIYNAGVDETVRLGARQPIEKALGKMAGEKTVVACGRLAEQKGFSHLLEAFARIRDRVSAHLIILGEGPLREELEAQVRRLRLGSCVELPGFQENPFSYMAAADVFVLSSLWEGFGNVVVEAMACGTAVITTDCPHGPGEIVEGGESGLLVSPADPKALADAMERILTDDVARGKLAEAGKERAQDFTAERVAAEHEVLFQRLMEKS